MTTLLVAAVIILLASTVHAVTGFGYALVATPLLALTVDPHTAVVATTLSALAMTITIGVRQRHHAEWKVAMIAMAGILLGMPLGLWVYGATSERVLTALIGVGVLGCTLMVWRRVKVPGNVPVLVGVGLLSGALSTSTGTNGPPMVAAFQGMGYDPRKFRATLAAVFAGTSVFSLIGFAVAGQVNSQSLWIGLVGVPVVQLGYFIGDAVFSRIDPDRFRRVVLLALIVSAGMTLFSALNN
ncbi:sulfite exporter TauE/SafE family protein [Nonomuraea fuscirosea]|uniref:sulfite exporter TauE/SafE family protein n=1 Tax=Nonomuraea fuscirosea TaxID=1291556 RepID=UPI002DD8D2B1|nr:sulfite exporter TauE/SafE family protein [Nonomuraea fuscirosea]WSA57378.1 sulfite exporter TauE/SafE family protein [Nonomuraea fuscirosea]